MNSDDFFDQLENNEIWNRQLKSKQDANEKARHDAEVVVQSGIREVTNSLQHIIITHQRMLEHYQDHICAHPKAGGSQSAGVFTRWCLDCNKVLEQIKSTH